MHASTIARDRYPSFASTSMPVQLSNYYAADSTWRKNRDTELHATLVEISVHLFDRKQCHCYAFIVTDIPKNKEHPFCQKNKMWFAAIQ
jgi:hypothetical protein